MFRSPVGLYCLGRAENSRSRRAAVTCKDGGSRQSRVRLRSGVIATQQRILNISQWAFVRVHRHLPLARTIAQDRVEKLRVILELRATSKDSRQLQAEDIEIANKQFHPRETLVKIDNLRNERQRNVRPRSDESADEFEPCPPHDAVRRQRAKLPVNSQVS